jgi:hypothetical protein
MRSGIEPRYLRAGPELYAPEYLALKGNSRDAEQDPRLLLSGSLEKI